MLVSRSRAKKALFLPRQWPSGKPTKTLTKERCPATIPISLLCGTQALELVLTPNLAPA